MPQQIFRLRETPFSGEFTGSSLTEAYYPEVLGYEIRLLVTSRTDLLPAVKDLEIESADPIERKFHFFSPASTYVAKSEHVWGLLKDFNSNGLDKPFLQFYTGEQFSLFPTVWKYAVRINSVEYAEFVENLKRFGFSTRSFKKVGEWLWISDSSVIATVKLFSDHRVIDLKALNDDFCTSLRKYS